MEISRKNRDPKLYLFLSLSYLQLSIFFNLSWAFSPLDNYLIDCGSYSTVDVDNRYFVGDSSKSGSVFLSATRTISLKNQNPSLGSSPLYHTARVFTKPSNYEFEIKKNGIHLVRFHFLPFSESKYNLSDAQFHVSVHGFLLLSNFSVVDRKTPVLKEYLIWVDSGKLVISFMPWRDSSIAFVNAIEVISAPEDLIADTARFVSSDRIENCDGLTKQALETVYRITMGGPKVTPFNDSLWRTWIPDDGFLKSKAALETVYFSGRIQYQRGGASREIAPDNVYNTARVTNNRNVSMPDFNITWGFPVSSGYKYLVRMHFCDIVSMSTYLLYLDIYINGNLAYKDLGLSELTNGMLAAPYYADFVVYGDSSRVLSISIGASSLGVRGISKAILNGLEIMKMNNSMGSLDGELSVDSVLKSWPKGNIGILVPLVAVISLLIVAFAVIYRRRTELKDSVVWSPLPVDVSKGNLKYINQLSSGKLGFL
ncbi:hypothetical protein HHK36_001190 [Tetracentron sinense]|uniref:Malectin-like domain-containing protein n=1 Tax=Tetracentron sinense TaxID=13715 RepID=A0A834ZSW3_TETSI|nr:hypothetical protein HHK36_001190 [Tetracentron sinense]